MKESLIHAEGEFEKKYVQTTYGEIFYFTQPACNGKPTLVFLHGLSSNHTTWLSVGKKCAGDGYGVVLVDMRGHGYSDKRKKRSLYTFPQFAKDLRQIILKENIQRCVLVGYSYGGEVALEYTITFKDAVVGLVLISTNMVNPLVYRHVSFLTPVARYFYLIVAMFFFWQYRKSYHYYQYGEVAGYWRSVFGGLMTMPISINLWMLTQMAFLDFRKTICQIAIPTVLVGGLGDPFLTQKEIDDMKDAMQNAYIVTPQINGHYVARDAQEQVELIILQFLNKFKKLL
ncbi:MAG: alpha/beta hydrolase [Candidatus Paceibacterota bacterium]|jgi:pimeloyl-ACP methyl ester carboxylesterase